MTKLSSSFIHMFFSLTLICAVAGASLASGHYFTSDLILESQRMKLENAIREVVPKFNNSPSGESYMAAVGEGDSLRIYPAKMDDRLVGAAVESNSITGFNGEINVMVGFDSQGKVLNYVVVDHTETPGLGDKMVSWFKTDKNRQSIVGKNMSGTVLKVTKDGGEIDAITAATISSRAFLDAVNRAYAAFSGMIDSESGAGTESDGTTGATQ